MRRAILLFLKYPEPGRVKTRIATTVGAPAAAAIYRELVAEVCRQLPSDGETLVILFDPPERKMDVEVWLSDLLPYIRCQYSPQSSGDLGARLENAFAEAFAAGFEQIAVIGSDCVELTPETFAETWRALAQDDVALGPTTDGGYYLLALSAPAPALFQEIAWSTDAVFTQTLARAGETGLRVSLLRELRDVDTEDDWRRAEVRIKR
jgi:rSAM/selenodomain-associated transferase 1